MEVRRPYVTSVGVAMGSASKVQPCENHYLSSPVLVRAFREIYS